MSRERHVHDSLESRDDNSDCFTSFKRMLMSQRLPCYLHCFHEKVSLLVNNIKGKINILKTFKTHTSVSLFIMFSFLFPFHTNSTRLYDISLSVDNINALNITYRVILGKLSFAHVWPEVTTPQDI